MAKKVARKAKKAVTKKPFKPVAAARRPSKPAVASKKAPSPNNGGSSVVVPPVVSRVDSDRLLTLSFLRDGDEYCVRLETATGQITEFKNRSPDQLLTMVAGELEDLLS